MSMKPRRVRFTTSMCRLRRFAFASALCLLTSAFVSGASAAVYRWVDEQGKVHYAEVVPQRYQGAAKRVAATANEPSVEQRREALERAQQEKATAKATEMASEMASEKAGGLATGRQRQPASTPSAAAASRPAGKQPAQRPEDSDSPRARRLRRPRPGRRASSLRRYPTIRRTAKPGSACIWRAWSASVHSGPRAAPPSLRPSRFAMSWQNRLRAAADC